MLKKLNLVGVIVGALIIIFAIVVFALDVGTYWPIMSEISPEYISEPSYESPKYYGGDAYTGMQQASAQTANNLIPVFKAIEANNSAIQELNSNNIEAAQAAANNAASIISTIKYSVGFILLSIGLCVISKNIEFEVSFAKKEEQVQAVEQ